MTSQATLTPSAVRQIFTAADIDNSLYLTAAKLRHFMGRFGLHLTDTEMSEMVKMFDETATGRIHLPQFESILPHLGFRIAEHEAGVELESVSEDDGSQSESDEVDALHSESIQNDTSPSADEAKHSNGQFCLAALPSDLQDALRPFDTDNSGYINLHTVKQAALQYNTPSEHPIPQQPTLSTRGLGPLIGRANHIALIVSDIGRSAKFYSEVLGFKQVPRPNFDEHGAWFTMGNLELHLIKGRPAVHNGDDLIVGHISLETTHIEDVPAALKKMGVPFRQNVSVPSEKDAGVIGTNASNDSGKIVEQYFITDPDGYWLEICNCHALEDYVHGEQSTSKGMSEEVEREMVKMFKTWIGRAQKRVALRRDMMKNADGRCCAEEIAKVLGCEEAEEVDEELLDVFMSRTTVYGDVCQGQSKEELEMVLKLAGNCATKANQIMSWVAEGRGGLVLQPPAFYEEGTRFVLPPRFMMKF